MNYMFTPISHGELCGEAKNLHVTILLIQARSLHPAGEASLLPQNPKPKVTTWLKPLDLLTAQWLLWTILNEAAEPKSLPM